MKNKLLLIKVGGAILHDGQLMTSLCADIKVIIETGYNVILVHGGGKAINEALALHGIKSEFVDGLRVTSSSAIKVIEMVLCGQINKALVRKLNRVGVSSFGLSGAENHMLLCEQYSEQHGFVGHIKEVNTSILKYLLSFKQACFNSVPVIAPIGVDKQGYTFNINADMAAYHIANALGVEKLIYLTDKDGIYDSQGNFFSQLSAKNLQELVDKSIVTGGMLVKVKAILASLKTGLNRIMILNGNQNQILLDVMLHGKKVGTLCEVTEEEANGFTYAE